MALTRAALDTLRKAIGDKIAELEVAISTLREELAELDVVDRVMQRIDAPRTASEPVAQILEKPAVQAKNSWRSTHPNRGGKGKFRNRPDGSPSNAQIIMEALSYALECGVVGFEPSEIVVYVQRRVSPDYVVKSIPPTCWQMMKEGKIAKYGDLYGLIGQDDPEPAEKSEAKKAEERMIRLMRLEEVKPLELTEGLRIAPLF